MEKWMVVTKRADFKAIAERFHIDQVTARLIRNRDVIEEDEIRKYLHGTMEEIPSPWLLKDMRKAVAILQDKIAKGRKIRIIGDYDIDGVMATYILLKGLTRLGAVVDTYIPDRIADGYGMSDHLVEMAYESKIDTIVTCDNGIAALPQVNMAKNLGMTVIVTDHHPVKFEETLDGKKETIPNADAVINPQQMDCEYPFKAICGAVVAFKLICALYEAEGIPLHELKSFYQFAGFATVGDVMPLKGENRILVKQALIDLKKTDNYGLKELIRVNNLEQHDRILAYHIGFILGPCINASGRMDTALRALKLLQTQSQQEAAKIADELKALNETRKALTEQWKDTAIEMVENSSLKEDKVLVVFLPECHESLAGLIASKLREKYYKPSIVLTRGANHAKGSGRSIEDYDMNQNLKKCEDLFIHWGGHPMAAGISLEESNIDEFRRRINEICELTEENLIRKIRIDVPMPLSYVTKNLIRELAILEPYGNGNEKPLFAQAKLEVKYPKIIGKNRNVVKMLLVDENGNRYDGIYFGEVEAFYQYVTEHSIISITYYPDINVYKGVESIQYVIQQYC